MREKSLHFKNRRHLLWLAALGMLLSLMFAGTAQAARGDSYSINIKGTYHYTQAYALLNAINAERADDEPLIKDESLMQKAMQRAAELSVMYNEEYRPDWSDALSISSKANATNVLYGVSSSSDALAKLLANSKAKANLTTTAYKSVGIGCFSTGSNYYWCLLYSTKKSASQIMYSDITATATVRVLETIGTLKVSVAGNTYADPTAAKATLYVGKKVSTTPLWQDNSPALSASSTIEVADNSFTWASSDKSVAKVNSDGRITGVSVGSCTITGTPKIGSGAGISIKVTVKKNTIKCSLEDSTYTYTGSKIYPKVTVKRGKKTLTRGTDYTLKYKKNKNVGYGQVVVKGKGNYSGQTETLLFLIKPAKMKLTVKAKTQSMKLSWTKSTQASGYELQIAANKKMTKDMILEDIANTRKSVTIKNLETDSVYYVRIRQFKLVGGERVYGKWSSKKKVTIK